MNKLCLLHAVFPVLIGSPQERLYHSLHRFEWWLFSKQMLLPSLNINVISSDLVSNWNIVSRPNEIWHSFHKYSSDRVRRAGLVCDSDRAFQWSVLSFLLIITSSFFKFALGSVFSIEAGTIIVRVEKLWSVNCLKGVVCDISMRGPAKCFADEPVLVRYG